MKKLNLKGTLNKLIPFFILLADASLIIRIGITKPYTLQPFEFFILISFLLSCVSWSMYGIDSAIKKFYLQYGKLFVIIASLLSIGTIAVSLVYGITRPDVISLLKDAFYLITIFLGLILHAQYGIREKFRSQAFWAMSLPLLFTIFLIIPQVAEQIGLLGNSNTLVGLHNNQSVFAIYLLISLAFFFQKTLFENKISFKLLYWLLAISSFSLILWTGSRGAWLASAMLAFSLLLFVVQEKNTLFKKTKVFIGIGMCIAASGIVSFLLLPHSVKVMALDRVFPSVTNYHPDPETLNATQISISTIISRHADNVNNTQPLEGGIPLPAYQDRQNLWPQAIKAIARNPEGLGPEYAMMSKVIRGPDENWIPSHNTFLQIALSGGIALLIVMAYVIFILSKKLYELQSEQEKIFLFSLWIAILFSLVFNDHFLALPWVWILAGIILGKIREQETV